MSAEQSNWPELKRQIAAWSVVTKGLEVPVGLEAEEAWRRAHELLPVILGGEAPPESVTIDDDLKHVLSLVVSYLRDAPAETRLHDANAVYHFIRRLPWPQDAFGEQQDLLLECAETGWASIGLSLADMELRRRTAEQHRSLSHIDGEAANLIHHFGTAGPVPDPSPFLVSLLADPEVLFSLCGHLRDRRDDDPAEAVRACERLDFRLRTNVQSVGVLDQRDYLLGEIALIAGGACRLLGRRDEVELWLDRAEGGYRHTVNAGPLLANVSYERISAQFEKGLHSRVLELLPSLSESFLKFGMEREFLKCGLVEVMSLTATRRKVEARGRLEEMRRQPSLSLEADLEGAVFMELGESFSGEGQYQEANECFQRALPLLKTSTKPIMLAHLKGVIGESLRQQGRLVDAVEAYRAAISDYAGMAMATWVAYLRVVLSETLLAVGQPREAEWEILQALPTIEEQKMVPEGFAAVALLRESVKRQKADPNALRELREHLQKQK